MSIEVYAKNTGSNGRPFKVWLFCRVQGELYSGAKGLISCAPLNRDLKEM